jgi:PAS domain S-box-containing protein
MPDRVNILLVDDQPNNLIALEAMLADLDVTSVRAESGTEALRRLLDQDFAVILLDVQMPGLDGFETADLIRKREKSRHTPIIFVTALSRNESNVFQGYSVGAVDYLFKPIVPEILRSKVQVFVELFRKTRELKRQTAQLERLSRQNELILNSAADGVIGVDLQGQATAANPAAARMIGDSVASIRSRPVHHLLHPKGSCDPTTCELARALEGEPLEVTKEDEFVRRDGTPYPVEYSVTMMRANDALVGSVLTFRDVTERKAAAMAEEHERLYREAQAANQAKDDFLATLSHELRTPMTAILGWNEILDMGDLDDETRDEAIHAIRNSARAQAQLIDDMLDVSRIIMGKFDIDLRSESLPAIVEAAINTIHHQAEAKGVRLSSSIDYRDATVLADQTRLRQVLWNLLSNAVKFTDPGGEAKISLDWTDQHARITVADTGIGIDSEMLIHVFDRLVQTKDGKNLGGLGLGLAIARHIVELHGGTIDVDSEGRGRGTTFTVLLPLFGYPAQDGEEQEATEHKAEGRGQKAEVKPTSS